MHSFYRGSITRFATGIPETFKCRLLISVPDRKNTTINRRSCCVPVATNWNVANQITAAADRNQEGSRVTQPIQQPDCWKFNVRLQPTLFSNRWMSDVRNSCRYSDFVESYSTQRTSHRLYGNLIISQEKNHQHFF
jgi:hypothetical protein